MDAEKATDHPIGQNRGDRTGGTSFLRRDPEATRAALLAAATAEFARHGYAGARIERLVKRAGTSVRMVYHYFGSKSALYIAVLEAVMRSLRHEELKLDLRDVEPLDGLLRLFDFIYDHFDAHPELISLLSVENLQRAKYLSQSAAIQQMSSPVIGLIDALVRRGIAEGRLRRDLDPLQLYVSMVALSYFPLSNVHTLSVIFARDLTDPAWRRERREAGRTMLARYLAPD
jgi:AcrR family transcriptional regulator